MLLPAILCRHIITVIAATYAAAADAAMILFFADVAATPCRYMLDADATTASAYMMFIAATR